MRLKARFDKPAPRGSRRGATRRPLRLTIQGTAGEKELADVLVHNLSATGALLQTSIELDVGTALDIELPEASTVRAKVVWKSGEFFGCQFPAPLSRAVLSAAQLSSDPESLPAGKRPAHASDTALEIGARVREWRQRNGLTVAEFAQRMQVSRPTVWAWETGKSKPRRSMLARLVQQIGAPEGSGDADAIAAASESTPHEGSLQDSIATSKERIAEIVGTSPDKVRIIVEL